MKNLLTYKILFALLIVLISGCSTKKNTWLSRSYHATNTRYNVYFNGYVSYNEGLKNILQANKEDYSSIIPMYPISHHTNASAATSNMDLTIEKCRKAIKLHSIKIKPTKNYKKANSPDYKLFYSQEEFNPALKEAWLLLGKAEFHKGNFLGSVGTFSYIVRHYSNDKDMEATCQLWIARAYGEMGWIYEAEQVLSKIKQDDLKRSNIGLFASINADVLLKKHQYNDAIPFLQLALSKESDKNLQIRFGFLLAQLNQKIKNNKAAYEAYSKVIKSNPPYEMAFNARINRAQLDQVNISIIRKELLGMAKNRNNKEYLDQLYYAIGNTYLQHSDTLKAIENYKLSAEKSTRKGINKAVTLMKLGDLYYIQRNYVKAQPCYDEAGKIITNEHEDYSRVTRRGEMLSELVTQSDIVILQDSLQRLSAMPESKRLETINKLIEKLNADEKAAADKELKDKQNAIASADDNFANLPPIGGAPGMAGDWYFYNIDVMRNGESDFQKKWGKRKLEDNWRRTNKSASLFAEETSNKSAVKDSTDTISKSKVKTDNKKPEFYLSQIPVTPAQIAKSTADIATALFSMGEIYKDKIEDIPMAVSTFEEFIRRFKSDERVADAYFYIYLMQTKVGNQNEAGTYRLKIINEYPKSKYGKILSQPDYTQKLEDMYKEQDSIYNLTYKAYIGNDFKTVYKQVSYIRQNFPLSTLMPKFLFLNALSVGKNESSTVFKSTLNDLVTSYPESDVSAMAKDILALMKQGQENKNGTSSGSLITRRDENTKEEINEIAPQQFSSDKQTKHRLLFISSANKVNMNKLLFNIASFNFSRFMIKDFDLVVSKIDTSRTSLSVTNLESYDEAVWYENSIATDSVLTKLMNDLKVQKVIISEENYALLKTMYNLKDYLAFQLNPPVKKQIVQLPEKTIVKKQESALLVAKVSPSKQIQDKTLKADIKKTDKKIDPIGNKADEKTLAKTNDKTSVEAVKAIDNLVKKPVQPSTVKPNLDTIKTVTKANSSPKLAEKEKIIVPVVQPKEEVVPLFKGLFGYKANESHYIAIYIVSGKIDFEKTKAAFDTYNSKNYSLMNLKVSLQTLDKQQVIIVGSLSNALIAKSYLLRMVKEKVLFEGLKGANYRNLLGSQKNLNVLIQQNALKQYFEFMQEYYLK